MLYVLLIIIFSAIHHHAIPCYALPIPESVSAVGGEQNAFMLGTITFFILGIALIGCACCRRQKKGFEEFQNELSTQENNKTEYPIFRALSPESQRNHLNGNSNVMAVNNSNENLINDDYDNNNGPISIADLENIENNNANDYIQSQNTIEIPIESPEQCRTSEDLVEFHNSSSNLIQNISSVSSAISEGEEVEYSISNSSSCHNFIEDPYESDKNINDHQTENENNVPIKQEYIENEWKNIRINEKLSPPFIIKTEETETNNQIENTEKDKIFKFLLKNDEQQIGNVISRTTTATTKNDDDDDDDGIMNKSNEDNSIEEALRALDNVIDSEDINMDEEDIEDDGEIFYKKYDENSINFQYVIQQLFINNIGGSSSGGGVCDKDQKILNANANTKLIEEEIDNNSTRIINNVIQLNDENNQKISTTKDTKDTIRNTAELLIDSIMKESSQIVEMLKNTVEYKECFEKSFAISKTYTNPNDTNTNNIDNNISLNNLENNLLNLSANIYHHPIILMNDESYNDEETKSIQNLSHLSHESLENLFTDNNNIGTSTPCVRNKFITKNDKFYTDNSNNNCKLSLEDSEDSNSLLENSRNENNISGVVSNLKIIISPIENGNETFDINKDRTFNVNNDDDDDENNKKQQFCDFNFIHPGDPCTSKQALERDYGNNNNPIDHEENNFKDLTTLTPMNTPIELNYSCETWNQMLQNTSNTTNITITTNNQDIENIVSHDDINFYQHQKEDDYQTNETFDVADDDDDENEANLESTFEALKKQLAEILPQPQGITALPEYSDDEETNTESNRVFDEYRSPFDGIIGLLETEDSAPIAPQSEIFINYKRSLSPIMEESEDETCKTFVMMNETRCLDSTSSECVGTGEAIMGVTKVLMASNDTLFNFEDTLGEKEDGFSPRISSQNDLRSSLKSEISLKSEADDSAITPTTESSETEKVIQKNAMNLNLEKPNDMMGAIVGRRSPPKTICFVDESELKQDNDLCSPDQQKTFSDGTSSTTDRISSDISPTVDHDTTFTTNTIDEKTCITVLVKDDERISEISEPDWDSTTSCGECVFNSLADIPNLDFNIQNSDGDSDNDRQTATIIDHSEKLLNSEYDDIDKEINCRDDSGHSTQVSSTDDKSTTNNISMQDMIVVNSSFDIHLNSDEMKYCKSNSINEQQKEYDQYEICLINDDKDSPHSPYLSSNQKISQTINLTKQFISKENNIDHENIDTYGDNIDDVNFDIKEFITIPTTTLHQKVQIQNCNIVINDKEYLNVDNDRDDYGDNNGFLNEIHNYKENENDKNEEFNEIQSTDFMGICKNEENERMNHQMAASTINHNLSGEEDPWMKIDTDTLKECCDIKNDWDSDVEDDSHSSEEFMYIRGSPSKKEDVLKVINATDFKNSVNNDENEISELCEDDNEMILNKNILDSDNSTVLKPKNIKDLFEEEDNGSDFESEFIPSCWDSMAIPARSALKSPDKTNNKNKKRRNVAFKKQRYDSVYEYPRENVSLPPFYSESSLLSKNYGNETCFKPSYKEEFSGGFTVSSSMRPFYDCHFSNLSYTWPTDLNFSWSQSIEDMDNKKLTTFSDTIIKTDKNDLNNITKNKTTMDNKRPDSGVGESAEMLSDRIGPPLGELCHTKPNLHLALRQLPDNTNNLDIDLLGIPNSISVNDNYTTSNNINNSNSNSSNSSSSTNNFKESQLFTTESIVLPTPSCTGSMDSLSSSSDSERQSNNFLITNKLLLNKHHQNEKLQQQKQQQQQQHHQQQKQKKLKDNNDEDENEDDDLDHNHHHNNICYDSINTIILNNELLSTTKINNFKVEKIRQNDSTDEDSGIESIMKVNK